MGISAENMLALLLRKERFFECVDELVGTIDGGVAQISVVIGAGSNYSETAAKRFVDDIVDAYNHFPFIEHAHESGLSYDDYLEMTGKQASSRGVPALLDIHQQRLVKSLLYCLMRIIADGPFFKYRGTFDELKHECAVMLDAFAHGVRAADFWYKDVERFVLSDGKPTPYTALALDPASVMYRHTPVVGADGLIGWSSENPTFFLDDLTAIYEAFSGTPVAESLPARQRKAIMADSHHYSYLKETRLYSLSKEEAAAAERQGWLDADDVRERDEFEEAIAQADADRAWLDEPDEGPGSDNSLIAAEEQAIAQWIEDFPHKDAWCKQFLAMRKAYFKLEGIDPLTPDFDEKNWRDPHPINAEYLAGAIDAVLDQRGISHFTDDACLESCDALRRASSRARRFAARRREP